MSRHFQTAEDLGMWIEARVEGKDTYAEVNEAVIRFVAIHQARHITTSFSLREIADLFINGQKPIDNEYVNDFLDIQYKDLDTEDTDLMNKEFITNLKTHFGL